MLVIGIAGGIASGKSLVSSMFCQLGANRLDADEIGHRVLELADVKQAIHQSWGDDVFKNQQVDRTALARIVFDPRNGATELERLERITHPKIGDELKQQLDQYRDQKVQAVVLDAPVMFKAGWDRFCDKIVFIHADLAVRQQRVEERGWQSGELEKREAQQLPLAAKRERSTDEIDNSGSIEATYSQVIRIWHRWRLPMPVEIPSPTEPQT